MNYRSELAKIAALRDSLESQERWLVAQMRAEGMSWQQIAEATGMKSRQAAQHRYDR